MIGATFQNFRNTDSVLNNTLTSVSFGGLHRSEPKTTSQSAGESSEERCATMTCKLINSSGLSEAFHVALLLTGSTKLAEAAVLDSIQSADAHRIAGTGLLGETIKAAIQVSKVHREWSVFDASPALPVELRSVMHLSPELRYCFVTRVLAGLTLEVCAGLLEMEPEEIMEGTCAAIEQLAMAATSRTENVHLHGIN